ncbi:Protein arginine N-methyltransferase like protein [Aduncisulcus paluster]|uniref:Protein arginine N-methyltransferase like protein n=1 Tax=Aduncisulcus paluster TaxID=2918883 RepID=A0ABQ5JZ76_9EUKA|nr:Protein arginine N-methyltransferase like protein [Aduncisulcus paluster]
MSLEIFHFAFQGHISITILMESTSRCEKELDSPSIIKQEDEVYFDGYGHHEIHSEMIEDPARTTAYLRAINSIDIEGRSVLDVGSGSSILSMFAVQAGARVAVGVEASDVVDIARKIIRHNEFEDDVVVVRGYLEDIPPPQILKYSKYGFDVIMSEWMGFGLFFEGMLSTVIKARNRYSVGKVKAPLSPSSSEANPKTPLETSTVSSSSSSQSKFRQQNLCGSDIIDLMFSHPSASVKAPLSPSSSEANPKTPLETSTVSSSSSSQSKFRQQNLCGSDIIDLMFSHPSASVSSASSLTEFPIILPSRSIIFIDMCDCTAYVADRHHALTDIYGTGLDFSELAKEKFREPQVDTLSEKELVSECPCPLYHLDMATCDEHAQDFIGEFVLKPKHVTKAGKKRKPTKYATSPHHQQENSIVVNCFTLWFDCIMWEKTDDEVKDIKSDIASRVAHGDVTLLYPFQEEAEAESSLLLMHRRATYSAEKLAYAHGTTQDNILSTSPFAPSTHWAQTQLYLSKSIVVLPGDTVKGSLSMIRVGKNKRNVGIELNITLEDSNGETKILMKEKYLLR